MKNAERAFHIAQYMLQTRCTIRKAAEHFEMQKTTVHHDLTKVLPRYEVELSASIKELLAYNKAIAHLRGGEATRLKWKP